MADISKHGTLVIVGSNLSQQVSYRGNKAANLNTGRTAFVAFLTRYLYMNI